MKIDSPWKIHTKQLLEEVLKNPSTWILKNPLRIFDAKLREVAQRCAEVDDPVLNKLMCDLTLYSIADPTSEEYDPEMVEKLNKLAGGN